MRQHQYMSLRDAATDFRAVRRSGYSPSTWNGINRILTRFEDWIYVDVQPGIYLTDVDDRHMVRFFDRYRPPAYEASSFNNFRQYMMLFFDYCREEGWIHSNPMRHVKALRVNRRPRLQLSKEELLQLLEQADSPRDRAALALGMNTAQRAQDVMGLKVGDLDFYTDRVTMWIEKTDETIVLPMTAELHEEMLRWLTFYASEHGLALKDLPNDWMLVPPCRGVAIDVNDLSKGTRVQYKVHEKYRHPERIVQAALAKLGHPTEREGFHTLRRSMLRAIYDDGLASGDPDPIRLSQTLANHKSRATTELYLGVTQEKRALDEKLRGRSFLTRDASGKNEPQLITSEEQSA